MISVRRLSRTELDILTRLFKYNDARSAIKENERMIDAGEIDIFCIFDDDLPFGELRVKYKSEDKLQVIEGKRVYLYAFRINKDYRGRGYGKMLMENVIGFLKKMGIYEFTIGVGDENQRAKHIYQQFGFTKVLEKRFEEYQSGRYHYTLYLKS